MILVYLTITALLLLALALAAVKISLGTNASTIMATSGKTRYVERFGQPGSVVGQTNIGDGNGSGMTADQIFAGDYTLGPGNTTYLDLRDGAGTPLDVLNNPLSLATVKAVIIEIDTPMANNVLRLGPAGNAAGAPLWLGNNTQSESIHDKLVKTSPIQGWTVETTKGLLILTNAGNQICSFKVRIVGVKV